MEQLNFSNLTEAAGYAQRGSNSAVLKRLDYRCCHPLLQDGNVLVDLPGIDAPVKKDADLTYRKIEDPDSSAVVCVLKAASAGEMTTEETELLEKMRSNLGICDRCRQCYQCLPCPEAINIPEVLRLRNLAIAYNMTEFGQYRYQMFENAGHWFPGKKGNRCTECGDCLPRCPEQLEIPKLLKDSHQRLNGSPRRRLWET